MLYSKIDNGVRGRSSSLHGANADDLTILMPLGTVVKEVQEDGSYKIIAELLKHGQKVLLAQGGKGGKGNEAFKSAITTAPRIAEKGEKGVEFWAALEMRLIADVGLIGMPNAGKSTFLAHVSDAKPKIANYPFTTLVPNLGIQYISFSQIVYADLPGLIEGAAEGVGLGHKFLRHVKRCRVLVHILDGTQQDIIDNFMIINAELRQFDRELAEKRQIVVYNKIDIPEVRQNMINTSMILVKECGVKPEDIYAISAATGEGFEQLSLKVHQSLQGVPRQTQSEFNEEIQQQINVTKVQKPQLDMSDFDIKIFRSPIDGNTIYQVQGRAIERFIEMGNFAYYDTVKRFQSIMERSGINQALRKKGIENKQLVQIGDMTFDWYDTLSEATMYGAFKEEDTD